MFVVKPLWTTNFQYQNPSFLTTSKFSMSKTAIFDIESPINSISMTKSSLFDIEIFSTQHKLLQPYIVRLGELFDF